jgi:hypothetical protein
VLEWCVLSRLQEGQLALDVLMRLPLIPPSLCCHNPPPFNTQASAVFLSDIPRYDLSSDYILLAEQRQAEADLKDKFERLTLELQVRAACCCVWQRVLVWGALQLQLNSFSCPVLPCTA